MAPPPPFVMDRWGNQIPFGYAECSESPQPSNAQLPQSVTLDTVLTHTSSNYVPGVGESAPTVDFGTPGKIHEWFTEMTEYMMLREVLPVQCVLNEACFIPKG